VKSAPLVNNHEIKKAAGHLCVAGSVFVNDNFSAPDNIAKFSARRLVIIHKRARMGVVFAVMRDCVMCTMLRHFKTRFGRT